MVSDISRRRKDAARDQTAVYQERRTALLNAAAATFREQGLDGASLNEIANRAGLDRASLYYYVASKEDLYRAVVEDVVRDNVQQVEEVRDGPGTGAEKLALTIRTLMSSYEKNYPHLFIFVAEDFGRRGPKSRQGRSAKRSRQNKDWRNDLSALGDTYHNCVRAIVAEGFADGSLVSKLSPGLVAHGVVGMVNASHRWYRPDGDTSAAAIADGFVDMIISGISPSRRVRK